MSFQPAALSHWLTAVAGLAGLEAGRVSLLFNQNCPVGCRRCRPPEFFGSDQVLLAGLAAAELPGFTATTDVLTPDDVPVPEFASMASLRTLDTA